MLELIFIVTCICVAINLGVAIKNRNSWVSLVNWIVVGLGIGVALVEWKSI